MNYYLKIQLLIVFLFCTIWTNLYAAQQYQGLCARVKIEILQELTLERVGFLATLEITNNEGDAPITNFSAMLSFENPLLSNDDKKHDASSFFFVRQPELTGINKIDGEGIISPGHTAIVEWFIIPTIEAGGETPEGIEYNVGADLAGAIYGKEIDSEVLLVIPDSIIVRPEPQLEITYFQPRDVHGDNPFTLDIVEKPIPFIVGVLVRNVGFGTARNVMIESQQPKIVENKEGLLLIAQLLGARVNDAPLDKASLTINLGDISPSKCRKGAWDMITSLSGEFIEFNASYTHESDLGGEATSVITDMNAYFIAHEVLDDQAGRDDLLDFLADTDNDENQLPDTLYETDCSVLPVNTLHHVSAIGNGSSASVTVDSDREGWVYMRVNDPAQAKLAINSVVRSDGKSLNEHNYWTDVRYKKVSNERVPRLHIFDLLDIGQYQYQVNYAQSHDDHTPPETTIRFSGEYQQINAVYYILPQTLIYFTVEDISPTGTYFKMDDEVNYRPAYPFQIQASGEHQLSFYSQDAAENREYAQNIQISLLDHGPTIQNFNISHQSMIVHNDTVSIVPSQIDVQFKVSQQTIPLEAYIEIFKGISETTIDEPIISDDEYDCSHLEKVFQKNWNHVDGSLISFQWDGKNDAGHDLPSGYYTMRLTVSDVLGQKSYGVQIIQLGRITSEPRLVDEMKTIQTNLCVANHWAVWQDQRNENWDIFAQHLINDPSTITITDNRMNQEYPDTDGKWVVWEDYQTNGLRDIFMAKLSEPYQFSPVTQTVERDEARPSIDWPWIVYQVKPNDSIWQIAAFNVLSNQEIMIDRTQSDQKDPCIDNGRIVWQDFRDPGYGEIYYKDLIGDQIIRITNDPDSQYHPVISNKWIVWEDKRHVQKEFYARHLDQDVAIRLTDTSYDENLPSINGEWVVGIDNSFGPLVTNIFMIHLPDSALIRLTHSNSKKQHAYISGNTLLWEDNALFDYPRLYQAQLPVFQAVYPNNNAVLITAEMAQVQKNAFGLLTLWYEKAGIEQLTFYKSLIPIVETQTAKWQNGQAVGDNFLLAANTFVWVKFDQSFILNLGNDTCNPVILNPGPNIISYGCFPDNFSSYQLIEMLGRSIVKSVRMPDASNGKWEVTIIENEQIMGADFPISRASVLLIDVRKQIEIFCEK